MPRSFAAPSRRAAPGGRLGGRAAALMAAAVVLAVAGCRSAAPDDATSGPPGQAVVTRVVDGDTIRVRIGSQDEAVRLIGIDTPETHGRGGLVECFGKEATARTAALLPAGTSVRLVGDVEQRDHYGRLLAYVYRSADDRFVNLALAGDGFAAAFPYPPNTAHAADFEAAEAAARGEERGLWGACGGPDRPLGPRAATGGR